MGAVVHVLVDVDRDGPLVLRLVLALALGLPLGLLLEAAGGPAEDADGKDYGNAVTVSHPAEGKNIGASGAPLRGAFFVVLLFLFTVFILCLGFGVFCVFCVFGVFFVFFHFIFGFLSFFCVDCINVR